MAKEFHPRFQSLDFELEGRASDGAMPPPPTAPLPHIDSLGPRARTATQPAPAVTGSPLLSGSRSASSIAAFTEEPEMISLENLDQLDSLLDAHRSLNPAS